MRLFGRVLLVLAVVCLLPVRSEAALMDVTPIVLGNPLDPGTYNLSGSFANDNDIAVYAFTLSATSTITAELTSFLCPDGTANCDSTDRGFDPILTLLDAATLEKLAEAASLTGNDPFALMEPLDEGDYLLAITQFHNFYLGAGIFEHDDLTAFTQSFFEDPRNPLECADFIAATPDPECRNNRFAGTLIVESTGVPEPGTLSLLALGGAAVAAQRRRRRSSGKDTA
jgi:hypothetical protein